MECIMIIMDWSTDHFLSTVTFWHIFTIPQMLHGAGIFTYKTVVDFWGFYVGKYSIHLHGASGIPFFRWTLMEFPQGWLPSAPAGRFRRCQLLVRRWPFRFHGPHDLPTELLGRQKWGHNAAMCPWVIIWWLCHLDKYRLHYVVYTLWIQTLSEKLRLTLQIIPQTLPKKVLGSIGIDV